MPEAASSSEPMIDIALFYGDAYFAASIGQKLTNLNGLGAEITQQAYEDYQAMQDKCALLELEAETEPDLLSSEARPERHRYLRALIPAAMAMTATAVLAVTLSHSSTPRPENIGAGRPAAAADGSCASIGEASLASMPIGQSGFTVDWGYFRQQGKTWVNPEYCYSIDAEGTSNVPIRRVPGGFDIKPGPRDPIRTGSMSDFVGESGIQPMHGYLK